MIRIAISMVMTAALLTGCSGKIPAVDGRWIHTAILADGSDHDWPDLPPQFYDEESGIVMRVLNNEAAVFVLVSAAGDNFGHAVAMGGLVLILDPHGDESPPFKVSLKGGIPGAGRSDKPLPLKTGSGRPEPAEGSRPQPLARLPESVDIYYPYGSDPVTMSLAEARESGIRLGLGQPEPGRVVFEAMIRFDAVSSFGEFGPGARMTVGIESSRMAGRKMQGSRDSDRKGPPPGGKGRMKGQGGRQGAPRDKGTPGIDARVDVTLLAADGGRG